ncbi:mediator of RNA polymerase II transcription subunit 10b [Cryptomeria japonica]|uniref:mediator of RNA polymerase II transcription subunit 10b n=1 Tax=Cryptomeria japonica TaxID=3369 RepID=UPI0027DA9690|nr:mediator of RNA polymerase II transcription subunit 10b [Cryptomeria japonica]
MDSQNPGGSAGNGGTPIDLKHTVDPVSKSIQKSLGILHQLHCTVSSFNINSQLNLLERVNSLVGELDQMQKAAQNCDIQVPLEVIKLIDDGRNPDEYTKDIINKCIQRNQITKGKSEAFKNFRKQLLEELELTFPEEIEAYRELRSVSAAELKKQSQAQASLPNGDVKVKSEH